jgi:HEPN domain-containing protein
MGKAERIKYWVDIADYDLKTAKAMLDTMRYLYVGFMCHQVIEKILKALYTKLKNDTPPYTHNLNKLADLCGLFNELNKKQLTFLDFMNPMNIQARYPSYKDKVYKSLNKKIVLKIFNNTKEFVKWVKKKL